MSRPKIVIRHVDLLLEYTDYSASVMERLLSKYTLSSSGCWEWNESTDKKGRAVVKVGMCRHKAARVMYVLHNKVAVRDLYVLHTCDNILCINPEHLWVGTHEDNMEDMRNKGRSLTGDRNPKAKLNEEEVRKIKKLLESSTRTLQSIAYEFGTTKGTISHIKLGKTWKHL